MFFRERELQILSEFQKNDLHKACAIYGRRRVGKTELILNYVKEQNLVKYYYYQCTGYDYAMCLEDFKAVLHKDFPDDTILESLKSFRDVFKYLSEVSDESLFIVIDEFPFLCKKNDNAAVEFQWIIDHAIGNSKIVLLGSNLSFMKNQINNTEAPLYGRFDDMIEVMPFTFQEVRTLFPVFDDAVDVYAMTGGVAQYVMMFKAFGSVKEAIQSLFFNKNGRLFQETQNLLLQELRDVTTYISILRALSSSEKDSGQIAAKAGIDARGVFSYLNKLISMGIISVVDNPLSHKKHDKKYRISDALFRFSFTFIEPNVSMISAIGKEAMPFILDERYREYLGTTYEDIIRSSCYEYALKGILPFMPVTLGKWWGNVEDEQGWHETEVDLVAYDDRDIIIGECKFKNKKVGMNELKELQAKIPYISAGRRNVYILLASRSGFTEEVKKQDVILIDKA